MNDSSLDTKTFKNPAHLSHNGTFSVELVPGAPISLIPPGGTQVNGNIVTVRNGRLAQSMGGIQLYNQDDIPFTWGYSFIKSFRDETGNLLWVNWNHR